MGGRQREEAAQQKDLASLIKEGNQLLSKFSAEPKYLQDNLKRLNEWKQSVAANVDRRSLSRDELKELNSLERKVNSFIGVGSAIADLRKLDSSVMVNAGGANQLAGDYMLLFREVALISLFSNGADPEKIALLPREFTADDIRKQLGDNASTKGALAILERGDLLADVKSVNAMLGKEFGGQLERFSAEYNFLLYAGELGERMKGSQMSKTDVELALMVIEPMKKSESGFIAAYALFLENRLGWLSATTPKEKEAQRLKVEKYVDASIEVANRLMKKGDSPELFRALNFIFMELNEPAARGKLPAMVDVFSRYSALQAANAAAGQKGEEGSKGITVGIGPGGFSLSKSLGPIGSVFLEKGGVSIAGMNLLTGAFDPVGAILSAISLFKYIKGKKKMRGDLEKWVAESAGVERAARMAYAESKAKTSDKQSVLDNTNMLLWEINHPEEAAKVDKDFDANIPYYTPLKYGGVVPTAAATYILVRKYNPDYKVVGDEAGEQYTVKWKGADCPGKTGRMLSREMDDAIAKLEKADPAVASLVTKPVNDFLRVRDEFEQLKKGGFGPENLQKMMEFVRSGKLEGILDISFDGNKMVIRGAGGKVDVLPVVFGKDYDTFIADLAAVWALCNVKNVVGPAIRAGDYQAAVSNLSLLDYFLAEGSLSTDVRRSLESYKKQTLESIRVRGEMAGMLRSTPRKKKGKGGEEETSVFFNTGKKEKEEKGASESGEY